MKMNCLRILGTTVAAVSWLAICNPAAADVLAGWESGGLANSGPSPYTPTVSNPNVTVGGLTRGPGVASTTTANVWGGSAWNVTNEATAISGGKYAAFSVQATAGYTLSLTSISKLYFTRSATGPTNGALQYSTNGGATFVDIAVLSYGVIGTASTNNTNVDLSGIAALQNLDSNAVVMFRLANWGASSAAGTWYINNGNTNGVDLVVSGTLGSIGVAPRNLTVAPSSIVTNFGATAAFTVTAGGDPASNFWYKVVGSVTNLLPTATSATLTLSNLTAADTANYFVVLSNASGTNVSSMVSLVVNDPAFVTQPASMPGLYLGTARFSAGAIGSSLSYQWYFSDVNSNLTGIVPNGAQASGSVISGADTPTLTITNLQFSDPTNFVLVVSNSFGTSLASSVASLLSVGNHASLVFWDFNGPEFTSHITIPPPFFGIGTAQAVGSCNNPGTSPFSGAVDPIDGVGFNTHLPNFSWGSSSYPASGSNKLNGVQFTTSTVGAKNIQVSYDSRVSATASEYERLQYTTNGSTWIDFPYSTNFANHAVVYFPFGYNLTGFPGVDNNPNFGVRIVTEFQSTATYGIGTSNNYVGTANTYGTTGTVTYDIVNISGDSITNNNTPPTITSIPNTNTPDFTPITVNFTIGDLETAAGSLTLSAESLNRPTVDPGFSFGGSGANRTLTITPNFIPDQADAAPILVRVTDGNGDSTVTSFLLTLTSVNLAPTNSLVTVTATNTLANVPLSIPFKVGDDRTLPDNLTFTLESGNSTLVPVSNITVTGTGTNRTLTITPATNQLGVVVIGVTVNDVDTLEPRSTKANIAFMVRPNTNVVAIDYFNYDTPGALDAVSGGFWQHLTGNFGQMQTGGGIVLVNTLDNTENLQTPLLGAPYRTNSAAVLYSSFIVNLADPDRQPRANGTYFALFNDGSGVTGNYECRVVSATNGAAPGKYRLGINNFGADATTSVMFPQDLDQGSNYVVVTALVLSNGFSTLWVNPSDPSSLSVTDTTPAPAASNLFNIADFELRESGSNGGAVSVSKLKVGTTFDSVLPALHAQTQGTDVVINWSDPTLSIQAATNVSGPYLDLPGVSSSYLTNASGATQLYFRFKPN
jgi:hypothetical protein